MFDLIAIVFLYDCSEVATMVDTDYERFTVVRLREIFKERGIPATGLSRKAQLIERLREVDKESSGADQDALVENDEKGKAAAPAEAVQDDEAHATSPENVNVNGDAATGTTQAMDGTMDETADRMVDEMEVERTVLDNEANAIGPHDTKTGEGEISKMVIDQDALEDQRPAEDTTAEPEQLQHPQEEPNHETTDEGAQQKEMAESTTSAKEPIPVDAPPRLETPSNVLAETMLAGEEAVAKITVPPESAHSPASAPQETPYETPLPAHEEQSSTHNTAQQPSPPTGTAWRASSTDPHPPDPTAIKDIVSQPAPGSPLQPAPDTQPRQSPTPTIAQPYHTPTTTLYIRNLKRPLKPPLLESHLQTLADRASPPEIHLWIDPLRTHAYAQFPSLHLACRARDRLHDVTWPNERERERLFVDYIAETQYTEFITREEDPIARGRRWEIVYDDTDGTTCAVLREVGAPAAPTAPRGTKRKAEEAPEEPRRKRGAGVDTPSFGRLGELFRSTTAKPMLYYAPVSEELVERRRAEVKRYDSGRLDVQGGSGEWDSRRYSFEEKGYVPPGAVSGEAREGYKGSWRLVDGGPEFGLRGPRRGGRGRVWR